jgi:catechol 2,3-dioxygenase-like lactoylglutathione lyase family enzyme
MIQAVRHTGIVVTDMDKALRFYRDLLGLNTIVYDVVISSDIHARVTGVQGAQIHAVMLAAPDGNRIELLQYLSHPRPAPKTVESHEVGCSHVAFTVENVDLAYSHLSSNGVAFNSPPQVDPTGSAKFVYCHDYDGTIIELTQVLDAERIL